MASYKALAGACRVASAPVHGAAKLALQSLAAELEFLAGKQDEDDAEKEREAICKQTAYSETKAKLEAEQVYARTARLASVEAHSKLEDEQAAHVETKAKLEAEQVAHAATCKVFKAEQTAHDRTRKALEACKEVLVWYARTSRSE